MIWTEILISFAVGVFVFAIFGVFIYLIARIMEEDDTVMMGVAAAIGCLFFLFLVYAVGSIVRVAIGF